MEKSIVSVAKGTEPEKIVTEALGLLGGVQSLIKKKSTVVIKPNAVVHTVKLSNGVPVKAVHASNVDHIMLRHTNKRVKPQVFTLEPKQYSFKAKIVKPDALQTKGNEREDIQMKAVQLPVIINNATTGHKLQGNGVDNIFVHTWSYTTNWAYVMLSRVKVKKRSFHAKTNFERPATLCCATCTGANAEPIPSLFSNILE